MHRAFKGVLFDIDGTLVESNECQALAWIRALRENGKQFSLDEICPLIGMGSDQLLKKIGVSPESDVGQRTSERKNQIFRNEYLSELQATPGTVKLLEKVKALGLKIGIATSASDEDVKALLKACGAEGYFDIQTTKSDASASKPAPNIIESALEKLGTYPAETVMIGDTPYDVEAAAKCGVQTILLRCGGWTDEEVPGAIAYFDHPADLLENLEFSPLSSTLVRKSA